MPSWGTAQFITALMSTVLYLTKNLIICRVFVSVVASRPGVRARQLGRNCSEQQNWGLNMIHWGRDSTVPAERNPDWNLLEFSAGTSERKGLRKFSAKINCPRGCLPSPPLSKQQQEAGRRWLVWVCGGGHQWSQKPAHAKPIQGTWWGAHMERGDRIPKSNSRGLLRVLVLSSEVVKCQKNCVAINPG